jgi:hypothetical protein
VMREVAREGASRFVGLSIPAANRYMTVVNRNNSLELFKM